MVLSVNSSLTGAKERQMRAMQSGLVQAGAPINTNYNVSNSDAKAEAIQGASAVSFSEMLQNSSKALESPVSEVSAINHIHKHSKEGAAFNNIVAAPGDATNVNDNNTVNAEVGVIRMSDNDEKQTEISETPSAIIDEIDQYLTDQDKAFLENLNVPDEMKTTLKLSIALDRKNGTLTGPITAHYLYGEKGLLTRMGSMVQNYLLEGKDTDTMLDVMKNLRKLTSNILEGLTYMNKVEEASREDGNINIYNADTQMAKVDLNSRIRMEASYNMMQNWVENYYKDLEQNESFLQKLSHPEERPETQGGMLVAKAESEKQVDEATTTADPTADAIATEAATQILSEPEVTDNIA